MYKVIGNAVPPKLAKVLAEEILYQFWSFIGEIKMKKKYISVESLKSNSLF